MVTTTGTRTVADKGVATSGAVEATAAHMAAAEARAAHMTTAEAGATHMASATTKSTAEATATTTMASAAATTTAAAHIRQIRVGAGGQLLNGGEGISSRCAGTHERCGTQYRQATQHLNSPFCGDRSRSMRVIVQEALMSAAGQRTLREACSSTESMVAPRCNFYARVSSFTHH
ncbi:MAG: hypothetical protein ABS54_00255 [Hyphomicrobium sp. SCN 65-11]|nr:MAG: hypothetical protein ABS54_00255 [Hyphomicrobium sp. SCN 65-11]